MYTIQTHESTLNEIDSGASPMAMKAGANHDYAVEQKGDGGAKCQNGVCSVDWKPSRPAA